MIKLTVNNKVYNLSGEDELRQLLDISFCHDFREIWMEGHGDSSLCVLTNKTRAFLMYLRYKGDCGFSSRNLNETNEECVDFKLSNGQTDSYPANRTVDKIQGLESLVVYFNTGERNINVDWEYDG